MDNQVLQALKVLLAQLDNQALLDLQAKWAKRDLKEPLGRLELEVLKAHQDKQEKEARWALWEELVTQDLLEQMDLEVILENLVEEEIQEIEEHQVPLEILGLKVSQDNLEVLDCQVTGALLDCLVVMAPQDR
jgi:hypothetical protein